MLEGPAHPKIVAFFFLKFSNSPKVWTLRVESPKLNIA